MHCFKIRFPNTVTWGDLNHRDDLHYHIKMVTGIQFGFCVIGALEVIFRLCHGRPWHKKDYFPKSTKCPWL